MRALYFCTDLISVPSSSSHPEYARTRNLNWASESFEERLVVQQNFRWRQINCTTWEAQEKINTFSTIHSSVLPVPFQAPNDNRISNFQIKNSIINEGVSCLTSCQQHMNQGTRRNYERSRNFHECIMKSEM